MSDANFTSVRDFWAVFFELTTHTAPPPRSPPVLAEYVRTVFGDLAEHRFGDLDGPPFSLNCHNCRNNANGEPRESVCQTHVGVVMGVLQAMTQLPLEATYNPKPSERCEIRFDVAAGNQTAKLTSYDKLGPDIALQHNGTEFSIFDRRWNRTITGIPPEASIVLRELHEERTPAMLIRSTGLSAAAVKRVLDQSYSQNLLIRRIGIETGS